MKVLAETDLKSFGPSHPVIERRLCKDVEIEMCVEPCVIVLQKQAVT